MPYLRVSDFNVKAADMFQSSRHGFSTRGTEVPVDLKDILRPRKSEGAGKTGCALHPRSRRRCCKKICCPRAYRFSGEHPASPTQWLYGLYDFVLVTGFLATIINVGFRFRRLDASTGASDPIDFTVRKNHARQS